MTMDMSELKPALEQFTKAANEKIAEVEQRLAGHQSELTHLHQQNVAGAELGARHFGARQSIDLGQVVHENEAFKALMSRNTNRCRIVLPAGALQTRAPMTSIDGGLVPAVDAPRLPGITIPALRRLTIRDLIASLPVTQGSVEYVRETAFTNNAAPVGEGLLKPESNMTVELVAAKIVTIAHWAHASLQLLMDQAGLGEYLETRLRYGLGLVEEAQLLNGNGTGNNLAGLFTLATAYAAPITILTPTPLDVLRLAIGQLENANYEPNGVVLHPNDWTAIELLKNADEEYIKSNPADANVRRVWGVPVVVTTAMTAGSFLVGNFALAALLLDRQDATLDIATQDQDDFVKNLAKLRVEERVGLAVRLPGALVKGELVAP